MNKIPLLAALGCAFATPLHAQEAVRLSGFGTLAATHFSRDDIDFAGGPAVQSGAGRTRNPSFGTDSKAGVQLRVTPTRELEFTVQAVAKETPREDWRPSIDTANVKYAFTDNVALRVGRIGHPFFMISDYRQVNYANLALRPSLEVYGLVPLTSSDVIEGLFKFNAGPGQLNVQTGVGQIDSDTIPSSVALRDHDVAKVRRMAYLSGTYEVGPWNLRVGHTAGDLTYDALALRVGVFDPMTRFGGATGAALRDQWEIRKAKASFTGIGASYDDGKLVAGAEYVMLRSEKAYNDADAFSVIAGYRIGKLTPYVGYAAARTRHRVEVGGVAAAMTPFVGAVAAARMQGGIQALANNSVKDENTVSVGLRWDVYKNLALKAQYDHIRVDAPSSQGFLVNPGSSYRPRSGGNVVAVALDFVF